jgi:hypothetical protein
VPLGRAHAKAAAGGGDGADAGTAGAAGEVDAGRMTDLDKGLVQCGGADALVAEHAGVRMGGRDWAQKRQVLFELAEVFSKKFYVVFFYSPPPRNAQKRDKTKQDTGPRKHTHIGFLVIFGERNQRRFFFFAKICMVFFLLPLLRNA